MPYPPGAIAGQGGNNPLLGGPPPPPVDKKKTTNIGQAYNKFVQAHKQLRPYSDVIWQMAREYNIDPVFLAAVLWHESKGVHSTKKNKTGDAGIAQINYATWLGKTIDGHKITEKDLADAKFQIRLASYIIRTGLEQGLTYENVYNADSPFAYNSGAGADNNPYKQVPKGYTFQGWRDRGRPTPGVGDPRGDLEAQTDSLADPWVTGVKKGGKLALASTLDPPGNVLKFDGRPMRQSDFLTLKRQMEETYVAYTGKRPSNGQIQQFILKGWSGYKLTQLLSGSKSFTNSPLWKAKAPGFEAALKDIFGQGEKVDRELIRKAIVNNWDTSVLQAEARKRPGYVNSNEFKGLTATMSNVYQSIYGTPTEGSMRIVQEATLGGWSPDQFAAWLRSRDEYVYTSEYRAKAVSLVEQLGFLTGNVAVLKPTTAPNPGSNQPGGFGPLPDDPRVKGAGSLPSGPPLAVGTL